MEFIIKEVICDHRNNSSETAEDGKLYIDVIAYQVPSFIPMKLVRLPGRTNLEDFDYEN